MLTSVMLLLASLAMAAEEYVSPEAVPGAITIDTAKAKALFDRGVVFIDVRNDADWDAGRIPGAIHLELKRVFSAESLGAVVAKDQEVVVYCNGPQCPRSFEAATKAVAWGFTRVYYYRLGFPHWQAADYPAE
ncbi:MAG TPA: rhodanese-like domain-containing protein [Candidatus Tectomicrobia bacterium]